jgi:O-acetyl-ADP-ribose deacetylase (regulator of RNase III)
MECRQIMQGEQEPTGRARITEAYCLPSKTVLHTVGPIWDEGIDQSGE